MSMTSVNDLLLLLSFYYAILVSGITTLGIQHNAGNNVALRHKTRELNGT